MGSERRKNFEAPGDGGSFLKHSGDGAIFFFAEFDGMFGGGFVDMPAQAVVDFEFFPDGGRFGGAFAGADDFQRLWQLAFFFENADDVGGGAGAESDENKFHRAGGQVGFAVGIDGDRMSRGTDGEELLVAEPFYSGGLHLWVPFDAEKRLRENPL